MSHSFESDLDEAKRDRLFKRRNQYYAREHECIHSRRVRFYRPGDWYHMDDNTLCNDGPKELAPTR